MNVFENYLGNAYVSMCMGDYPYEADFLAHMPGYPVAYSCWAFTGLTVNSSDAAIFNAMLKAAKIYYDFDNVTTCTDLFGDVYTTPTTPAENGFGWNILSCNEMVLPTASYG